MLDLITHLCTDFEVDGLRADIVMYKTAATLAAYAGRGTVPRTTSAMPPSWRCCIDAGASRSSSRASIPADLDRSIESTAERVPAARIEPERDCRARHQHQQSAEAARGTGQEPSGSARPDEVIAAGDPYAVRTLQADASRRETPTRSGEARPRPHPRRPGRLRPGRAGRARPRRSRARRDVPRGGAAPDAAAAQPQPERPGAPGVAPRPAREGPRDAGRQRDPVRGRRQRLDGRTPADGAPPSRPCCRCCSTPTRSATGSG